MHFNDVAEISDISILMMNPNAGKYVLYIDNRGEREEMKDRLHTMVDFFQIFNV